MEEIVRMLKPQSHRFLNKEPWNRIGGRPRKANSTQLAADRETVYNGGVRKDSLQRSKIQRTKLTEGLKRAVQDNKRAGDEYGTFQNLRSITPTKIVLPYSGSNVPNPRNKQLPLYTTPQFLPVSVKTQPHNKCLDQANYNLPPDLYSSLENSFCKDFRAQLTILNVRSAEEALLKKINSNILAINKVITGMSSSNVKTQPPVRAPQPEDPTIDHSLLIPKSKWVYSTPDKQRLKKMGDIRFVDAPPVFQPAVIGHDENTKTVYGLNEGISDCINFAALQNGQEVPIDLKYLKPMCVVTADGGFEDNQFLTQTSEDTITIGHDRASAADCTSSRYTLKRDHEEDDTGLNWYEKHMKTLATCKPKKWTDKTNRRMLPYRKSLSFEDTPNSHLRLTNRFKSLDDGASCRDEMDENDFTMLESEFYGRPSDDLQSDTLTTLPLLMGNMSTGRFNDLPAPKFYPRKNYD